MSVQDWCMVCANRTIGSEIVLNAPDGTPSLRGSSRCSFRFQLEIVLILMQDQWTVCVERTIGSDVIFDAPDGTPW